MKSLLWFLVIVMSLVVVSFIFPGLFHWLWFGVFFLHPVGIGLIVLVLVICGLILNRVEYYDELPIKSILIGCISCILLFVYWIFSGGMTMTSLVRDINVEVIEALPETTEVRYLPMPVAEKYGENNLQDPRHHLGDMDPMDSGETLSWAVPLVPTGVWNRIAGQMTGFMVIDPKGSVEKVSQPMTCGEGMWFHNNVYWRMFQTHYLAEYPEVYYLRLGTGEVLGIASYIEYEWRFPVMVPTWGGVMVVHSDCRMEDLSPTEAMADPRFAGQRLFPEKLVRQIAGAWGYRNGIRNAWFVHMNQTEVPHIDNEVNQMPYLLPTAKGPMWFVGLEPYGPAYAIYKIMYVDAHSGKLMLYDVPTDGLISPNRAAGYVRGSLPMYNWFVEGDKSRSGILLAIEPRPIVVRGVLYWQISVTNTDYAKILETVLLNASNESALLFQSAEELQSFLDGWSEGHLISGNSEEEPQVKTPDDTITDIGSLTEMSVDQLLDLQRQIIDELKSRDLSN